MKDRCLYCYEAIENDLDFHEKCSKEFFGTIIPPKIKYSLNQMDELAKNVVERSVAVPGVQPKLSMSLVKDPKENSEIRLTVIGALVGQYIFKPPFSKYLEMPANEHLTMRIAESFGIRVVPSSLIRLLSGELSYITKRIDRNELHEENPHITIDLLRRVYNHRKAQLIQFIRHILGLEILESFPDSVAKSFDVFIQNHSYLTGRQLQFLDLLKSFILEKGKLEKRNLIESPFTMIHPEGIRGVFSRKEIDEILLFTEKVLAA